MCQGRFQWNAQLCRNLRGTFRKCCKICQGVNWQRYRIEEYVFKTIALYKIKNQSTEIEEIVDWFFIRRHHRLPNIYLHSRPLKMSCYNDLQLITFVFTLFVYSCKFLYLYNIKLAEFHVKKKPIVSYHYSHPYRICSITGLATKSIGADLKIPFLPCIVEPMVALPILAVWSAVF